MTRLFGPAGATAIVLLSAAVFAASGIGQTLTADAPFDLVITGGRVVDGSGGPWFLADVGIRGDRIARARASEPSSHRTTRQSAGATTGPVVTVRTWRWG